MFYLGGMSRLATWLESHMLPCSFKQTTGLDCPSCGMQRSMVHLLRGELVESVVLFPALIPMLLMLVMLGVHLVFKPRWGATFLKWNFMVVAGLEVGHFLLKLF